MACDSRTVACCGQQGQLHQAPIPRTAHLLYYSRWHLCCCSLQDSPQHAKYTLRLCLLVMCWT
jgi:hypothetical protein